MQSLLLRELPEDIATLRNFARRDDAYDKLPITFTRLGFDPYAVQGDVITVDLNDLGLTASALPRGVVFAREITLRRAVTTGISELMGKPVGVAFYASVQAAAEAVELGLADYTP